MACGAKRSNGARMAYPIHAPTQPLTLPTMWVAYGVDAFFSLFAIVDMFRGMPMNPLTGSAGLCWSRKLLSTLTWIGFRPVWYALRDGEQY